jgi:hypothetical protein
VPNQPSKFPNIPDASLRPVAPGRAWAIERIQRMAAGNGFETSRVSPG